MRNNKSSLGRSRDLVKDVWEVTGFNAFLQTSITGGHFYNCEFVSLVLFLFNVLVVRLRPFLSVWAWFSCTSLYIFPFSK